MDRTRFISKLLPNFGLAAVIRTAKKTKDTNKADKRFGQAVEDFKKELELTEQLEDKQAKIQYQILAQYGLGTCYLEQAQKPKIRIKQINC